MGGDIVERMKLLFGKARVRQHVRGTKTGKQAVVRSYATTRAPGRTPVDVRFRMGLKDVDYINKKTKRGLAIKDRMRALIRPIRLIGFDVIKDRTTGAVGYALAISKTDRAFIAGSGGRTSVAPSGVQLGGYQYKMKDVQHAIKTVVAEFKLHHDVGFERAYGTFIYNVWETPGIRKAQDSRNMFMKAIDRLDGFLKAHWQKASGLFKSGVATTKDVPGQRADDALGAGRAPETVAPADDLASARDLGPETDAAHGYDELPWAAEDHAASPPTPEPSEALTKACEIRNGLQQAIAEIDEQLAHDLDDADRGRLLARHLDYLVKAEALTGRIEEANEALARRTGAGEARRE